MSGKEKWIAVAACFLILILCAGAGLFGKKSSGPAVTAIEDMKGRKLGGVEGRMPRESARIFFESMLGVRLSGYRSYGSMDEALCALRSGEVSAIWTTDISADYLVRAYDGLKKLDKTGMADISSLPEGRFEFGMAVKNDTEGEKLAGELNGAIADLTRSDEYVRIVEKYILNAETAEKMTVDDMTISDPSVRKAFSAKKPLRVGITGGTPPVELVDSEGRPYGFCVAMMDMIASDLERNIEFVLLDGETIFTSLMSGRIDMVFCYGTPGQKTTEGSLKWLMTDGYLNCGGYEILVTDPGSPSR